MCEAEIGTEKAKTKKKTKQLSLSHLTHRLAAFTDDSASCGGGNLDVRLQFDLLLRREEVLLFQLPKYPTLSLE